MQQTTPAYPAWMQKWNEKAEEIDEQLIAFYKRSGAEIKDLYVEVADRLKSWLHLDATAQVVAEPPPVKISAEVIPPTEPLSATEPTTSLDFGEETEPGIALRRRIQERVLRLSEEGRIEKLPAEPA